MILSKIQATLTGVLIGDAMGQPWETMTPAEILKATLGKGVTTFSSAVQTRIKSTRGLAAGDSTDDWQLTGAIARAIIKKGGIDLTAIAEEHLHEFRRSTLGWGRATRNSLRQIDAWLKSRGQNGRDGRAPWVPAPPAKTGEGAGNGVAMKISPVALWWHMIGKSGNTASKYLEVKAIGQMTHADPRASVAAYLIVTVLLDILANPITPENREQRVKRVLAWAIDEAGVCEQFEAGKFEGERLTEQLIRIDAENLLADPVALRERIGTGCYCVQSVPFAIATFLRHPLDFRAGVLEAVNAGGDTDSTASMAGAMLGANLGLGRIPQDWSEFRDEFRYAGQLGISLYERAGELGGAET